MTDTDHAGLGRPTQPDPPEVSSATEEERAPTTSSELQWLPFADLEPLLTVPAEKKEIRRVGDLLVFAYSREGKSFSITATMRDALQTDEPDVGQLREGMRLLAWTDPLLAVPLRILTAAEQADIGGRLRRTLLFVLTPAISQHPAFDVAGPRQVIGGDPCPDADALFEAVRRRASELRPEAFGDPPPSPATFRALTSNVVNTAVLLLAVRDRWPLGEVAAHLDRWLWRDALARRKHPAEAALLAESSQPAQLGLITKLWKEHVREETRRAEHAGERAQEADHLRAEALRQVHALEVEGAALEEALARRDESIAGLDRDLAEQREARRVDKSHALDDYERLRTRNLRSLRQNIELLENGLHALQHERKHVTEDHLERVIKALRADLDRLDSDQEGAP